MRPRCPLSKLSTSHPQLLLNRREVAAPGPTTRTSHQTAAARGGTPACCRGLLGAPGYPEHAPAHYGSLRLPREASALRPAAPDGPCCRLPQGCWAPWFSTRGDRESVSAL